MTLPRRTKHRPLPRRRGPEPEWPLSDPTDNPLWAAQAKAWFDWCWNIDPSKSPVQGDEGSDDGS